MQLLLSSVALLCLHSPAFGQKAPDPNLQYKKVQDLFDARCVTCHSCNSSPCQLDLASAEGIERGASKLHVYNGERLQPQAPTRMFIDAKTAQEWHQKFAFSPIFDRTTQKSFLLDLVKLNRANAVKTLEIKPAYNAPYSRNCPVTEHERYKFLLDFKNLGMPYGFPPLDDQQTELLDSWGANSFPTISTALKNNTMAQTAKSDIATWESYLNKTDMQHQLTARYLYEHWFIAHLNFSDRPQQFFRLVRSKTPPGQAIDEIATRRPYESPGSGKFYYRLRPVVSTIVHKQHILYALDAARLHRIQALFTNKPWPTIPKQMPSYQAEAASNPFVTFAAIPARSRYQFFLDEAKYFADTFIRGPVCEGQIAVNVINDHFVVMFVDPDKDLSTTDPSYLTKAAPYLELPAAGQSNVIESYYQTYKDDQVKYLEFRAKAYAAAKANQIGVDTIWDGDGSNNNAVLTILRHFDNASVTKGAHGGTPETVWIMDYPIFERMYYLLVAGFDVFGNLFHQLSTRLYMDNLRVESENNFLYLLGDGERHAVRAYWYQGEEARKKMREENALFSTAYVAQDPLKNQGDKAPVLTIQRNLQRLLARLDKHKGVVNQQDPYNCCVREHNPYKTNSVEAALEKLGSVRGLPASAFPELVYLNYKQGDVRKLYTLSRVSRHKNVSFLLNEEERRLPQEDRLLVMNGLTGSYPNYLLELNHEQLGQFASEMKNAKTTKDTQEILRKFGINRLNASFWPAFDSLHVTGKKQDAKAFGILDFSKYENL